MAQHVFISYSAADRLVAEAVCARLEEAGVRCWIAPRDIVPGVQWGAAIIDAINTSEVLVLVFSAHANSSHQVIREIERAVHRGIEVLPLRLEDVPPSKALEFYISSSHWLDAFPPPFEKHLDRLVRAVQSLLSEPSDAEERPIAGGRDSAAKVRAPHSVGEAGPGKGVRSVSRIERLRRLRAPALILAAGLAGIVLLSVWNPFSRGVTAVRIGSLPDALFVGDTFGLQASVEGGGRRAPPVEWSSGDSSILSRAGDTLFVAGAPGSVWLLAEAANIRDSVRVTVEQPVIASIDITPPDALGVGDSLALQLVARDRRGRNIPAGAQNWVSAATRIASVDRERGIVRARAPGTTRITANIGTVSASVEILVKPAESRTTASAERPNNGATNTSPPPVRPPITESALRALADSCVRALRAGDSAWIATNYQAVTGSDLSNLTALFRLFRMPGFQLADAQVLSPQVEAATVNVRARFAYRSSFGPGRSVNADFVIAATPAGDGASLRSCRVTGSLEL